MTSVVAVDPGYTQSAYVQFDGTAILRHGLLGNDALLALLRWHVVPGSRPDQGLTPPGIGPLLLTHVVFEQIEGFGMPVGKEVFETVFWTGRFYQRAVLTYPMGQVSRLSRRAVKLHLCRTSTAKDANVRMALLDRFGGKTAAHGTTRAPGPLFGIKADEWSALALAVTWWDQHETAAGLTV